MAKKTCPILRSTTGDSETVQCRMAGSCYAPPHILAIDGGGVHSPVATVWFRLIPREAAVDMHPLTHHEYHVPRTSVDSSRHPHGSAALFSHGIHGGLDVAEGGVPRRAVAALGRFGIHVGHAVRRGARCSWVCRGPGRLWPGALGCVP